MATNKLDLAKKHIEALTKGDWSTYRAMMSENAVYDEEATFRHAANPDSWTGRYLAEVLARNRRRAQDAKPRRAQVAAEA